jgi:hypothetical protein
VVVAPVELDILNLNSLRATLRAGHRPGEVVVADLSATRFCDVPSFNALLMASRRQAATGGELRIACTQQVRNTWVKASLDLYLSLFESRQQALFGYRPHGLHTAA